MKKKMLFLIVLILPFYLKSQNSIVVDSIEIKIRLEQDTIKVGEPIYYTITLKNNSNSLKETSKLWYNNILVARYPVLEYQLDTDSAWHRLSISKYGAEFKDPDEFPSYNITLKPNTEISKRLEWVDISYIYNIGYRTDLELYELYEADKIVTNTGKVKLRIQNDILKEFYQVDLFSNIATLVIINHDEKSRKAKEWLDKNLYNSSMIYQSILRNGEKFGNYDFGIWRAHSLKEKEKIEEFIQLFPKSKFTPWAKLYLCNWISEGLYYSHGLIDKKGVLRKYPERERSKSRYAELQKAENILKSLIEQKDFPDRFFEERALVIAKQIRQKMFQMENLGFNKD